jgi:amino acid transporter
MVLAILFVILVYALFMTLIVMLRSAMKTQNPKHRFIDDFLLFTGSPLCFGYCLFIGFFPYKGGILATELYPTPLTNFVLAWLIISNVILILRFQKNHKKSEKKEVQND